MLVGLSKPACLSAFTTEGFKAVNYSQFWVENDMLLKVDDLFWL